MITYDPRTISILVYQSLNSLKQQTPSETEQKELKNQAVEIYSYIATWGLLRLKAEEFALSGDANRNKREIVKCFFQTLGRLILPTTPDILTGDEGLNYLSNSQQLGASEYLGLTGIALQVAREFAFWAEALYPKPDR